jgi:hypothetical protein
MLNVMRSVTSLPHPAGDTVVIRRAVAADAPALERLAQLDSAPAALSAPVLVAVADGELLAARSLADGRAIADPFRPTAGLLALLETRAGLLLGSGPARLRGTGIRRRLLPARPAIR